jgi:hypothetical protein
MRARDLLEEWNQTDRCRQRTVTSIGQSGLFEVKCDSHDNYSNVLNVMPSRNASMPEPNSIVVASCNDDYIPVGPFAGTTLYTCARNRLFYFHFRIQNPKGESTALPPDRCFSGGSDSGVGAKLFDLNCDEINNVIVKSSTQQTNVDCGYSPCEVCPAA